MFRKTALFISVSLLVLVISGIAHGQDRIKDYFSNTAKKVHATQDATEKRQELTKSMDNMMSALDKVENSSLVSKSDKEAINYYRATLKEKQDELAGRNGFDRVPDGELNAFSSYVVQDMEQADQLITISLTTLLLILIIVILLA